LKIGEWQTLIRDIYHAKDVRRGVPETFMWFAEEVGEVSRALRGKDNANLEEELADCLAWLTTLASLAGVDLERAARARYGAGCPYCAATPCAC